MSFKNNFKIFILVLIFLFVGSSVFGANPYFPDEVSYYSRQPSGYKVVLPLDFSVIMSEYPADCAGKPFWNLQLEAETDTIKEEFFPNIASTTLTLDKEVDNIVLGAYNEVGLWCYDLIASTTGETWVGMVEYDDGDIVFEIGENYYFDISTELPTSTLAYAGQLFTDLNLIIILAVGLPLGFWVIRKIISLVRAR